MKTEMEIIFEAAEVYSEASEALADLSRDIQAGLDAVKASFASDLKTRLSKVLKARSVLELKVLAHPELFDKPRTKTHEGVKFGITKGKGTLVLPKEKTLLKRMESKFPVEFDELPRNPKVPGKSYFADWTDKDLRALGITIRGANDSVTIGLVQSETEERVEALLEAYAKGEEHG